MDGQHTENLFRRLKGETLNIKTITGGMYEGRVTEVTNDYVCLLESGSNEGAQVFIFFSAIESMMSSANDEN